jgi:hypothetical protein
MIVALEGKREKERGRLDKAIPRGRQETGGRGIQTLCGRALTLIEILFDEGRIVFFHQRECFRTTPTGTTAKIRHMIERLNIKTLAMIPNKSNALRLQSS